MTEKEQAEADLKALQATECSAHMWQVRQRVMTIVERNIRTQPQAIMASRFFINLAFTAAMNASGHDPEQARNLVVIWLNDCIPQVVDAFKARDGGGQ